MRNKFKYNLYFLPSFSQKRVIFIRLGTSPKTLPGEKEPEKIPKGRIIFAEDIGNLKRIVRSRCGAQAERTGRHGT
jgi:hypothetical protein